MINDKNNCNSNSNGKYITTIKTKIMLLTKFMIKMMIKYLRKTPIACIALIPSSICFVKHLKCMSVRGCLLCMI